MKKNPGYSRQDMIRNSEKRLAEMEGKLSCLEWAINKEKTYLRRLRESTPSC